jgi:cadherin 6 type 2 (K-cadherin)
MKCPPKPDLIGILLGVIGCIVCVGVVTLLLWKAFTTIHDRCCPVLSMTTTYK